MMVLLFSFLLICLPLVASEGSIDSFDSRIAQRISSDFTKYQSDLAVVESSLLAAEQDEITAYNSLQFLYKQASSESERPVSLAYATNLSDGCKHLVRCGVPAEFILLDDQLQKNLEILEKSGLSLQQFFYRNLTMTEYRACQVMYDICLQHKMNINQALNNSISAMNWQLQQIANQKNNLQQQKMALLPFLQVYNKIMTDVKLDGVALTFDESLNIHSDHDEKVDFNEPTHVQQKAAIRIQAFYRMSRAKQIPQIVAMHCYQDIRENVAKPLLYEILDGVDVVVKKNYRQLLRTQKEAHDNLCRQVQSEKNRKNLEETVITPILQSVLDKTVVLVDQREADRLLAATSAVKVIKKKKKTHKQSLSVIQPCKNDQDEILDTLAAQNKAQEEFQNVWISDVNIKLTTLIESYKATDSEIKGEGLASIVLGAIDQLEIIGLDSKKVAASFVKASISMNANLAKLHLDEDAKIAWLKDHQQKNFAFIMNHFDPNKKICHEYHRFHLSTLLSYLISFVDHALEVNLK